MLQNRLPYLLIIAVLVLGLIFAVSTCQNQKEDAGVAQSNAQVLLADKEQQVQDAEGRTTTIKQSLLLEAKDFAKIKGVKDSTIRALQAAVKAAGKKTSAAVVFTATTTDKAAGAVDSIAYLPPNKVVLPGDTVFRDAVYYGKVNGPGFTGWVRASPDSIRLLEYRVTQRFTVAFTDKEVQVKPEGTNTVAADVQSFQLPPAKKPKRGLWAIGGGVVVLILLAL